MEKGFPSLAEALRQMLSVNGEENFYAVINGDLGAGKTIFTYQMMWNYLQEDRTVAYQTTEDTPPHIIRKMKRFGWDIEPYLKKGRLAFIDMYSWRFQEQPPPKETPYGVNISPIRMKEFPCNSVLLQKCLKDELTRILFDCISTPLADVNQETYLQMLRTFIGRFREKGVGIATLAKGALPERLERSILDIFDVVVEATVQYSIRPQRTFRIVKSTLGAHPTGSFQYSITDHGFEIYKSAGGSF